MPVARWYVDTPPRLSRLMTDDRFRIACFNVANGDIENAPAIDALTYFPLSEKNGGVYIEGEEKSIKANRRSPNVKCAGASGGEKVVIVGG
jgi:hypothetical protein